MAIQYSEKVVALVPAYNEEERLPTMLDECLQFLDKRGDKYEVSPVLCFTLSVRKSVRLSAICAAILFRSL